MKKIIAALIFACLAISAFPASAQFYGGIVGSTGTPTLSACGTGSSLSASSIDHAGKITVGSGLLVTSCTLNFSATLVGTTRCMISPYGLLISPLISGITESSTGFTVNFISSVAGATIDYSCFIN